MTFNKLFDNYSFVNVNISYKIVALRLLKSRFRSSYG